MTTIGIWTDHPRFTTGFAEASKPYIKAFLEQGWDITVLPCNLGQQVTPGHEPYFVFPCSHLDPDGSQSFLQWINRQDIDVLWTIRDPGTFAIWAFQTQWSHRLQSGHNVPIPGIRGVLKAIEVKEMSWLNKFKIVGHFPIEGLPIADSHYEMMKFVQENGRNVFYSRGALDDVQAQHPDIEGTWVNHGLNHAPWRVYQPEEKEVIKRIMGLEGKFVVGTVGTNKRTKGQPELIYAMSMLKEMGRDNIVAYIHCDPTSPQIGGYDLISLCKYYGVYDRVMFKPATDARLSGFNWRGFDRHKEDSIQTLQQIIAIAGIPKNTYGRQNIAAQLSFIDLIGGLLDLYVDTSRVEGWGLPVGEAMACGVPVLGVKDLSIRDEVYGDSRIEVNPLPRRMWDTWQTGSRLVTFDPYDIAMAIAQCADGKPDLSCYSQRGLEQAAKYRWEDSAKKMVGIVKEVL